MFLNNKFIDKYQVKVKNQNKLFVNVILPISFINITIVTFHFYSSINSYIIKKIYISLINKVKICGVIRKS
ncbi:hypothetical protein Metev_2242 [Methanohalobium evestigatum Z-7303]|uniref:Uncharacterized protein n=1 Tax=Methanohalobium evestigatum (strain ATCC BAA-1072 / DSM 3721 / NBRC 107634 / OCM 161 / Z-7303) TaxID=644295 RepID=D7EBU2_METEZ|nr:hypothetical protein Metev_2242 [Methanohalobium evestigatum Z-7303]